MQITSLTFSILFLATLTCHQEVKAQVENEVRFSDHKTLIGYRGKKRKNPDLFQGNRQKKDYFEGWYFKMVSADESEVMSFIPGISLSEKGEKQHAFIQIINGETAETSYFSFPIDSFHFSREKFAIRISDNYFSKDSVHLNIQNDTVKIVGSVQISMPVQLRPDNKKRKAIMGWYRFVPFMQCYHGVVSLNHELNGSIRINKKLYDFKKGLGYIEKDWGESMPSSWIWIQSNSFEQDGTSFMLSVATIPWLGGSFTGFLGFFLHNNQSHRFGTYSKADLQITSTHADTLQISITDKEYAFELSAFRNQAGTLIAPVNGSMDRRIAESIDATLLFSVKNKEDSLIFEGSTSITGLEIVGDLADLKQNVK